MCCLFLLIFFLGAHFCAIAQSVRPNWVDDLGGASGSCIATYLAVDKQNNVYVTGEFKGTVDFDPSAGVKNLTSVGGYDIFLAKYTSTGTLIWAESMGGAADDLPNGLAVDKNGNVSIVGIFYSTTLNANPGPGVYNLNNPGGYADFVIHTGTNGNFLWAYCYDAAGFGFPGDEDNSFRVTTDSQGDVITTSIFSSDITIGNTTYFPESPDGIIIKYDPNGNVLWSINLVDNNGDYVYAYGARVDSQDNIVIAGTFGSSVNFNPLGTAYTLTATGPSPSFVAKYSPSGALVWVNGINSASPNAYLQPGLSIDPQNNIYFSTAFEQSVTFNSTTTLNATGTLGPNVCVAKYSPAGVLQFAKSIGGQVVPCSGNEMASDQNSNLYLTGTFSGTINFNPGTGGSGNLTSHGPSDFYVAKYDQNGNYIYAFSSGSASCSNTQGNSLAIDINNNADVAGAFCSTVNFDQSGCSTNPLTAAGSSDGFVVQYGSGSGVIANNVITAPAINSFCTSGTPAAITGSLPTGGSGVYTYQWQSSADSVNFAVITSATLQNYTPPTITATTYFERIVTATACAAPTTSNVVALTIAAPPAPPVVPADTICSGTTATLTVTSPQQGITYNWYTTTTTDTVLFTGPAFTTPALTAGVTYYVSASTGSGCVSATRTSVTVSVLSPLAAPVVPADAICSGKSATLTVTSPQQGINYNWYTTATTDTVLFTGPAFTTPALTAGVTYYVSAFAGSGCVSATRTSVTVSVLPSLQAPVVLTDTICAGSTAILAVTSPQQGTTYNWYTSATTDTSVFVGASFTTPALIASTIYYVSASASAGCTPATRTAVNVIVTPLAAVSAQGVTICAGADATLTATSLDNNAVITWYASSTGGTALATGAAFTTPALNADTTYYVGAIDNTSVCAPPALTPVAITVLQPLNVPVVTVGPATASTIVFEWAAVPGASGYQFSFDNGQTFSAASGLSVVTSDLQAGQSVTIIVEATGVIPCQLSAPSIAVTGLAISPTDDIIYVPNVFTPNGDGTNDIVHVHGINIRSLTFYIYDQWGEMLFSSTSAQNGWDGTYKGAREPVGVYVYLVQALMNDGSSVNKKGTVTLIR
jgi:gliding motility-associated-like protein